jgi:hypothetical protein
MRRFVREHRQEGANGLLEWYSRRWLESIDSRELIGS